VKLKEWSAFIVLGLVWGSSFVWIKLAVGEISPLMVGALRLSFGLAGLLVVLAWKKYPLPRDPKVLLSYAVLALFQSALPFVLFPLGETLITSALASVLNGTMPLFSIVIAHFWLHDEKITLMKIVGLIVGFAGVFVLVGRDLTPGALIGGSIWGQIAVLAATISYAIAGVFSRRALRDQIPVVQSTMVVMMAAVQVWIAVLLFDRPVHLPSLPLTWLSVVWLGLLGSCVAYLLYFYLLSAWGATRASVVTYVLPVVGLVMGVVFLNEKLDWGLGIGSLLVVAGIAVLNMKFGARSVTAEAPSGK
jgi:drug/metabolite transporter (DMT)-like permease